MKFKDFVYERPNYEQVSYEINSLIQKLEKEEKWDNAKNIISNINSIRNRVNTMLNIANVRYTINTEDKFYEKEKEFADEIDPLFEELNTNFYKVLITSKHKEKIIKEYGEKIIKAAEFALKGFSNEVIEDMQLENKLSSEYQKLIASAKILFNGEYRTLSELTPFTLSKDRQVRKEALESKYNFYVENEDELDRMFHQLVIVRDRIAKKLGYNNFIELGYIRMERFDYDESMVKKFRDQVKKYIVPINNKLYNRQAKRLGLNNLSYYDEKFEFISGNPTPKGNEQWIINNGIKMYSELSPDTKEFFSFMVENELMDLVSKKGKASGGYCTNFPDYKAPFIFSNFNGTAGDVDVLTHEAGHAFQSYKSNWIEMPECSNPTYESCEIHSMSMEFFTWPWMNLFFEEDTDKYKYYHLGSALKFIPYGITVDEFQHYIYKNPHITPKERKEAWRRIEKKYLPHKNYSECDFLERGNWWLQQLHIFLYPFYYIDYTLAQICALQFWKRDRENHKETWNDYLNLCSIGGTKTFLDLVKYANLKSPFDENCIQDIINDIDKYLSEIDDSKF
ncbi:M3 family oligoendopeptidase [Clostridium tarantellae]|uniref:M3 family oligoendopeptidase n=1 Tax=Clostridium tarantellae TaxID=39493 RepID=A0A6I1MWZ6_9CLOT|nr:M3 family oligoendopeptidase [Clostridium tarantellae]MPQ44679.1 M3 family oligoendopeptidase [Clostridium tarantellae]